MRQNTQVCKVCHYARIRTSARAGEFSSDGVIVASDVGVSEVENDVLTRRHADRWLQRVRAERRHYVCDTSTRQALRLHCHITYVQPNIIYISRKNSSKHDISVALAHQLLT